MLCILFRTPKALCQLPSSEYIKGMGNPQSTHGRSASRNANGAHTHMLVITRMQTTEIMLGKWTLIGPARATRVLNVNLYILSSYSLCCTPDTKVTTSRVNCAGRWNHNNGKYSKIWKCKCYHAWVLCIDHAHKNSL